jgi:hypothetical protein
MFLNNKSTKKYFIYGLFLGLIIGLTLSLMGVPQVVGNAIKINGLNVTNSTTFDEEKNIATISFSGALDPESKTFDEDFGFIYDLAVKEIKEVISEKGFVNCNTKQQLDSLGINEQISNLKNESSKNILKAYILLDHHRKLEYLKNAYSEEQKNNSNLSRANIEEDILYFDPPYDDPPYDPPEDPPYDPNNPPGGDGSDSGGIDWPDFPDFPSLTCSSCGEGSGVCLLGVCGSGGVGVSGCIIEGQKVLLANGSYKKVEDVFIGDKVISYNLNKKQMESDVITFTEVNVPNDFYRINKTLELTPDHKIYVVNKGFIEVKDLVVNTDYILQNDKEILVTSKKFIRNNSKKIYSFSVKNNKNLFINNVLVHNALPSWTKPRITSVNISFSFKFK